MKKLFLLLLTVSIFGLFVCSAQTRTIKGTVFDGPTGEPLIGVVVTPAGQTLGTQTDYDGNFTITIMPTVNALTFSYVGYTEKTVPVKDHMNVTLEPDAEMLGDVVVTGYGSGKKLGSIVGSVAVVGKGDLANVTTPSFVDALQGKVAGLSVLSSSGDPSSVSSSIRLRGINSLNSSTDPLFILDGAPVSAAVFNTINPNDIESITVLKDAASVAIYGTRAANGVIVITSKRGVYGQKAKINIRAKFGWSQLTTDKTKMMDSKQYVQYRDLIGQPVSDEQRYAAETLGISTNWRDETFDSSAPTYSLEAAVTGGNETTNYYLSLNHMNQEGIIDQSGIRRETLRISLSTHATEWLRVGVQANLGFSKFQQNNESNAIYNGAGLYITNPVLFARKAMPMDAPRYYTLDDNGQPIWGERAYYLHFSQMPAPWLINKNRSVWHNRVTANVNMFEELTPIKGLTIRAQQAVDALDSRSDNIGYAHSVYYTPMGDQFGLEEADPETGIVEGYNGQSFSRYYSFTYTNTAEYRFRLADIHNITLLLGEESLITKSSGFNVFTTGQTDARQPLLNQATSVLLGNVGYSEGQTTMNSIFLSGSYNYDDKYFLDINFRRDGSSYFAKGHRWGTFWSAGVMWNMKKEDFMKRYTWIDDARLRLSYGTTGNCQFANYAYFGTIGGGGMYNGNQGWAIGQVPNRDLTWERVDGLDFGIIVGLFHRVNADIAFYNKVTKDMLFTIPYSPTTGTSSGWGNVAQMRNTGVEAQISYVPVQTRDWMWEIRGNFSYNQNRIQKLYDGLDELAFPSANVIYRTGNTTSEFYMVRYAGVDPRDGKQMWYTREGNLTKVFNEERDAVCIDGKSPLAPWGGGFGTTLAWKGLSLRADFTWAIGKYMVNNDLYFIQNNNFAQSFNQTTEMLNVWTTPGQVTDIPAVGQVIQFDTRMLENASFLRLKTLTLQYQLPLNITRKLYLDGLNVHFTARNLLTFTKYTGYDPEPETNVVAFYYPNTRQFEFGIDIAF